MAGRSDNYKYPDICAILNANWKSGLLMAPLVLSGLNGSHNHNFQMTGISAI